MVPYYVMQIKHGQRLQHTDAGRIPAKPSDTKMKARDAHDLRMVHGSKHDPQC